MDYWTFGKAAVAIGCVLFLVWAVEAMLGRIVAALWGIANEIKATRVFLKDQEQQRAFRATLEAGEKAAKPKQPPVLNDEAMSPEAKRVLEQLQAQQNVRRPL